MGNYRELDVWKKSRALAGHVYLVTREFPKAEWFGLVQQMRRAAISVPSNIAEGHGRWSSPERIRFLLIARGSNFELETQAFLAGDLEFITTAQVDEIINRTAEITRMLNGLIQHYRRKLANVSNHQPPTTNHQLTSPTPHPPTSSSRPGRSGRL
jgi:four helix bundle protein